MTGRSTSSRARGERDWVIEEPDHTLDVVALRIRFVLDQWTRKTLTTVDAETQVLAIMREYLHETDGRTREREGATFTRQEQEHGQTVSRDTTPDAEK